jgi:UDP-N-acetylmuramoylalanine--D-glutamate ligase
MSEHLLLVGLGVTGAAVVRHAERTGAALTIVEDGTSDDARATARIAAARAAGARIVEAPEAGALAALLDGIDLVVPSPGVRPTHPLLELATAAGTPVRSEIDLASEELSRRGATLVAVTGTNGKTTVTSLTTAMLRASDVDAVAAGNIGDALLDAAAGTAAVVVAEVSSFQLHFTTAAFRPAVAVLLNVAEDHLDWHGDVHAYAGDKARVFAEQRDGDVLVYNRDDSTVVRLAEAATGLRTAFGASGAPGEFTVRDGALVTDAGERIIDVDRLDTVVPHDVQNALASAAAALPAGASVAGVARALRDATRLPHRVALVGEHGGVRFYDDSKATNPHATVQAVRAFPHAVLIAGGRNKGLDLGALRPVAAGLRGVVAIGEAADEVARAFAGAAPVVQARTMREAVERAAALAQPGDAVLLSPGCASFDWYGSYAERGDAFAEEVRRLTEHGRVGIG